MRERNAHRLVEALRSLGLLVELGTLSDPIQGLFDWCVFTNISEAFPDRPATDVRRLLFQCRAFACCSLDCADIAPNQLIQQHCRSAGIDVLLDLCLSDRSGILGSSARPRYHFILNGLTPSERATVLRITKFKENRPIPWVFIDEAAADRVSLVSHLISHLDPCGFVYMPNLTQSTAADVKRLKQEQYQMVLQRCRYLISYSPQQPFHMECDFLIKALLAGCVPIKIVSQDAIVPALVPFAYLIHRECEAAETLQKQDFRELRERFRSDFLALPSLADGLASFFAAHGILPGLEVSFANHRAA